jgi:hypothetical protein
VSDHDGADAHQKASEYRDDEARLGFLPRLKASVKPGIRDESLTVR